MCSVGGFACCTCGRCWMRPERQAEAILGLRDFVVYAKPSKS